MEEILVQGLPSIDQPIAKIEMDQSYRENDKTKESGIYSNESGATNEVDTSDSCGSSWQIWENEIADPEAFDPPIVLQSTNLNANENVIRCSLSSIDDLSLDNKGILQFNIDNITYKQNRSLQFYANQ